MQDLLRSELDGIPPVMPTYARTDFSVVRGKGLSLFDSDGNEYLDFTSGIGVTALGHCHPHLVSSLKKQAETLWHCSNIFRIPGQELLAKRLVENSFADTVFFTNSGVEAWECGLKIIRRYFHLNGEHEKKRVIAMQNGFHGRTLASISSVQRPELCEGFEPLLDGFDVVPFGNLEALEKTITPQTAAILLEPIQGEGGIIVADDAYLRGVREIADRHGLLVFFDEIQCGMGRTGKLFAYEHSGVVPDVMCIAKGLGGGFPVGACLTSSKVGTSMGIGSHGSTFGGNPLAMAAANAVMDVLLSDGFFKHVNDMAELLFSELANLVKKYPAVLKGLRGRGLMIGLQCHDDVLNLDILEKLRDHRMLCVKGSGNIVRMLPALVVEPKHINQAVEVIDKVCREIQ